MEGTSGGRRWGVELAIRSCGCCIPQDSAQGGRGPNFVTQRELTSIHSSYVIDPPWQRKFSIIWPSMLAFFVFTSLLHLVRSIRNGRAYTTLLGVSEGVYRMRR